MQLIILIDEDIQSLRTLEDDLKGSRYRIIATNSCKKGYEYARSAPPSLLIMGFNLNAREAIDTLVLLKKETITKNAPVLGILTEDNLVFNEYLSKAGMTSFLTRPIRKQKLVDRVAELIHNAELVKTNIVTNAKNHVSLLLNTEERVIIEFRSGIKNYVLPEIRNVLSHDFIKSALNKHICIDIRLLPEMNSEELIIFEKIIKTFGEKKISIITGAHMGNLIRNSDISENSNLFLSLDDYETFLENPDLDE